MAYWRNVYTNKEITEAMGIHNNRFYKIVTELELPKAPRVDRNGQEKEGGKCPREARKSQ